MACEHYPVLEVDEVQAYCTYSILEEDIWLVERSEDSNWRVQ